MLQLIPAHLYHAQYSRVAVPSLGLGLWHITRIIGGHWLVRVEWRPAGWSVCLLIFPCTIRHCLPFYIALCLLCSVDIFIHCLCYVFFAFFMINNDLRSVMIIL